MKRLLLLTTALLALGQVARAQPAIVGAGGQIQQIPRAPEAPQTLPDIRIERGQAPTAAEPAGPRIVVKALHVTGETQFTEADLIAATGFHPGLETDLGGLRAMAAASATQLSPMLDGPDMSPSAVTSRLREVADVRRLCERLVALGLIDDAARFNAAVAPFGLAPNRTLPTCTRHGPMTSERRRTSSSRGSCAAIRCRSSVSAPRGVPTVEPPR